MKQSEPNRFYHRIFKRPVAVIAAIYIGLLFCVAWFAHFLTPDPSPFADTVLMELATRPPGSHIAFLKKYHGVLPRPGNPLLRLWQGEQEAFQRIPVDSYRFTNDSVYFNHPLDESSSEALGWPLTDVLPLGMQTPAHPEKLLIDQRVFYMGTDRFGRDVFSRLLLGSRISLTIGLLSMLISLSLGLLLGLLAGYWGGRADAWISWCIQVTWSVPTLLLAFAVNFVLGKGYGPMLLAIGCTGWVGIARLVRGQVMSLKSMDFVQAARAMGFSHSRILFRHILPNLSGSLTVMATGTLATAILMEAGLSFLGLGVQPPASSWGLMMKENYPYILTHHASLALWPGMAILLLVLAFNLFGNGLRDAFDVRESH